MKKRFIVFVSLFSIVISLLAQISCAEKKKEDSDPLAQFSRGEIEERIKAILEAMPEVAGFIEGGVAPEDLGKMEKGELIKLLGRVQNEQTRIQTERIQRQLEAIRAVQNIPKPPPVPPPIPKPPPAPPAVPRVPQR